MLTYWQKMKADDKHMITKQKVTKYNIKMKESKAMKL